MGYSVSWIAVKGISEGEILDSIGYKKTGKFDANPAESDLAIHDMKNGWQLLIANHNDLMEAEPSWFSRLSGEAVLISCFLEEHVGYCAASGWSGGKRDWFVERYEDRQPGLKIEGIMPDSFEELYQDLLTKQKADPRSDYLLEAPLEISRRLTGFDVHEFIEHDIYWVLEER